MNWIKHIEIEHPEDPLFEGNIVDIISRIRNNRTGKIINHECYMEIEPGDDFPNPYIWADGNYSCDCNRRIFFNKKYKSNGGCSRGKYSVNLLNKFNNYIFYQEFDDIDLKINK